MAQKEALMNSKYCPFNNIQPLYIVSAAISDRDREDATI